MDRPGGHRRQSRQRNLDGLIFVADEVAKSCVRPHQFRDLVEVQVDWHEVDEVAHSVDAWLGIIGLSHWKSRKVGPFLTFPLVVIVVQPVPERPALRGPFIVDDDAVAVHVRFDSRWNRDEIGHRVFEMIP